VVKDDRKAGERSLDLLRWGLIPHWVKDINVGLANVAPRGGAISARS
jgi:putative SOS response-associated peptidase YedK